MTLIEIIKSSLLAFSALFVLSWIFFYLFLKFKKSINQNEKKFEPETQPLTKIAQRQLSQPSPVYLQPVIYPSINNLNQKSYYSENHKHYKVNSNRNNSFNHHNPRVSSRPERFVVFNNRQYGFYNV